MARELETKNRPLREQLRAALGTPAGRARPRRGELTEEQRPVREQLRENDRAALEEARNVLSTEHQAKLRDVLRPREGRRGRRGYRSGRRPSRGRTPAG